MGEAREDRDEGRPRDQPILAAEESREKEPRKKEQGKS